MTERPILHNIRILDFTWVMAGPYATRFLADYGAEVIKVQPLLPAEEDDAFTRGYYRTWNRNKLGITLNLGTPEGVALAKKLVMICDAVVENFTPRVMANFGLDYDNLKKIKPDIIMVSMSVMGQGSPLSYYTGYAPTVHALSGLTSKMKLDDKPLGPGFSYADHIAGLQAAMSLLAALEHRRRTGEGRHIDISDVDLMKSLIEEKPASPALEGIYLCKDGKWCAVTLPDAAGLDKLKDIMGRGSLESWISVRDAAEAVEALQEKGIAAGIVKAADDLVKDPQLAARCFFIRGGEAPLIDASPVKIKEGEAVYRRPAPEPGQDNDYVYGTLLGITGKEIESLKKNNVI